MEDKTEINQKEKKPEIVAKFVCCICGKTFYNSVALQNHKNLHHELDEIKEMESKPSQLRSIATFFSETTGSYTDNFVFIPLQEEEDEGTFMQDDGLPAKVFTEDTTYVVVRLAGDEAADVDAAKRRRLEGVLQRTRKPPVVIKLN